MAKNINLDNFHKLVVKLDYEKIMNRYAKKTQSILYAESPKSGRPARETPYWQGWDLNREKSKKEYEITIWNRTNWQLTHLLENGHFITNGRNRGGLAWSPPKKHIRPTYERIRNPYIRDMQRMKIDAEFE